MTVTVVQFILLLNIFACITQAALVKNQVSQTQQFSNNNEENSPEQSQASLRSSAISEEKKSVDYDHVNDLENSVLDNFDHRYPDGSYEYRYELADGQARYERGYFIKVNNQKSLVVVGYYSYRMPDGKFVTVFYNADRNGYRQNQAITRDIVPDLPRTIEVPQIREQQTEDVKISTTAKTLSSNQVSPTTKRYHF